MRPNLKLVSINKQTSIKLKCLLTDFCNNESNWIVGVGQLDLLNSLANEFNIPSFIQDFKARRAFEEKVFEILKSSKLKIQPGTLLRNLYEGQSDSVFVLQEPKNF